MVPWLTRAAWSADADQASGYGVETDAMKGLERMSKIEMWKDGEWAPPPDRPCYAREPLGDGAERLFGCVPDGDPSVFRDLVQSLAPPYTLLYILHTPRGEAEAGRYQSEELSPEQLADLVARHTPFLASDARFDLWGHSMADEATVVWDRHNQLYCYGSLDQQAKVLDALGFGEEPPPAIGPHRHFYRAEMDVLASSFLSACCWRYSPLRPEDEQ